MTLVVVGPVSMAERPLKLPDALIAGTALTHGLELLTLDEGLSTVMLLAR